MTTSDATPRESVRMVRAALDRIHDKYEHPVSLAFDLTDDDVGVIARLIDDAFERGYDEGYGMRSLERTGTWRTLGENTDER